jgi:hypothetical protein
MFYTMNPYAEFYNVTDKRIQKTGMDLLQLCNQELDIKLRHNQPQEELTLHGSNVRTLDIVFEFSNFLLEIV